MLKCFYYRVFVTLLYWVPRMYAVWCCDKGFEITTKEKENIVCPQCTITQQMERQMYVFPPTCVCLCGAHVKDVYLCLQKHTNYVSWRHPSECMLGRASHLEDWLSLLKGSRA